MSSMQDLKRDNTERVRAPRSLAKGGAAAGLFRLLSIIQLVVTVILRLQWAALILLKNMIIPPRHKDICGQVGLVTGGGNGIGRQICLTLAARGCHVAVADVDIENAERTATDCRTLHQVHARAYRLDVTDCEAVAAIRPRIEEDLGPVDILVNNAGVLAYESILDTTPESVQKVVNINLLAHFWTVNTFLDGMLQRRRGHIVALSSLLGLIPVGRGVCYSATKHGLRGMMESLGDELAETNVRTTTVYPYFINTNQVVDNLTNKYKAIKSLPITTPEEAGKIIVDAIQENNKSLTIPRYFFPTIAILGFLPIEMQQIIKKAFFFKR